LAEHWKLESVQKLSVSSIASSFSLPSFLSGDGLADSEFSAAAFEGELGERTFEFGGYRGDIPELKA